ncbi:MAG: hypothetical protein ACLT1W_15280 [Alistipes onderdonkii]
MKYKKAMAESGFSAEYYRELVYSHVDNINLLYVALTRAAESLHVFIPRKGGKSVGGLLLQSIGADGDKALLDGTEGRRTATEEGERFEFGRFTGPVPGGGKASDSVHVVLENYPTARADLRLRLPSQRYFEEEDEVELSPRNFGILMHKAFEQADDRQQIYEAVQRMRDDGTLSPGEAEALRGMIARVLAHPVAGEWFGGGWQRVRNENEIIVPAPGRPAPRPRDDPRHAGRGRRLQVRKPRPDATPPGGRIPRPAAANGLHQCEGYLWYVKLGKSKKWKDKMNETIGIIPRAFRRRGVGRLHAPAARRAEFPRAGHAAARAGAGARPRQPRGRRGADTRLRRAGLRLTTHFRAGGLRGCGGRDRPEVPAGLWLARVERTYIYDLYRTLSRRLLVTYHDRGCRSSRRRTRPYWPATSTSSAWPSRRACSNPPPPSPPRRCCSCCCSGR